MKYSLTLALSAVAFQVASVQAANPAFTPQCALKCAKEVATLVVCQALGNVECVCTKAEAAQHFGTCITGACNAHDHDVAQHELPAVCAPYTSPDAVDHTPDDDDGDDGDDGDDDDSTIDPDQAKKLKDASLHTAANAPVSSAVSSAVSSVLSSATASGGTSAHGTATSAASSTASSNSAPSRLGSYIDSLVGMGVTVAGVVAGAAFVL